MRKIIKNAKIVLKDKVILTNLLIENNKITKIGIADNTNADDIFDAERSYLLSGFIDIHTHLDDQIGKYYLADTYYSGSKIAVENGITTIFNFITQSKSGKLIKSYKTAENKALNKCFCNYSWHLTPITFNNEDWQDIYNFIEKGFRTFKFYTTYKSADIFSSYENLELIFSKLAGYDVTFLIHCEDDKIIENESIKELDYSNAFSHSLMRPKESEIIAVKKVLEINEKFSHKIHFVHISTQEAAELIYFAKSIMPVTCETCPQYFLLNNEILKTADGYKYLCSPPLRDFADMEALKDLAQSSYFDIFTTDHCPFLKSDKDESKNDIRKVPNGIAGLGSLTANIFNLFSPVDDNKILQISKHLSENPAKITGIYPRKGIIEVGADADLLVIDFSDKPTSLKSSFSNVYETYNKITSKLKIKRLYLNGQIIIKNNSLLENYSPKGISLCNI